MKTRFTFLLLLCLSFGLHAQKVDFDKVVIPVEYRAKTFPDFLVQLAWMNNPKNDVLSRKVDIAKEELRIKKWDWTKDVDAIFNYNEAHFIQDVVDPTGRDPIIESLIYPRFNFGARISLGTILNHPKEKKIAQLEVQVTELERDQEKLQIRADVLERYEEYLLAKEILLTREQAEEENYQTYQLINARFKKGEADLDEVNQASSTYYSAKESTITAKSEIKVAKIKIEELIGISFEDAEKYGPKEKQKQRRK
ncbi:MAG: TolC family protein [Bacteroidota bacterium]